MAESVTPDATESRVTVIWNLDPMSSMASLRRHGGLGSIVLGVGIVGNVISVTHAA